MRYKIISGKYETGTQNQQQNFSQLFGKENIQFYFDLYFHWFNIIHELGHCLVSYRKIPMTPVQEELYANRFAVAYWRISDHDGNLVKLEKKITSVLENIPSPVPLDSDFVTFFQSIWNREAMQTVAMYGYFQLACVMEAMQSESNFWEVLSEIGISAARTDSVQKYHGDISAECSQDILHFCLENLSNAGVLFDHLHIELELVDNPEVQCATILEEK